VLEFSYQLGSVFYADFIGATYSPHGMHAWKLEIKLNMQPFRYQKNVAPLIFTASGNINNPGSVYSEPVIEIEGDGDISLTIGRTTMHLTVRRKVTIDCRHKKQNIYNADGAVQNTLRKRGGFFELAVGNNSLVFTGSVRKVTVRPNWRYIL
ncbi:TPA: phage tail protein, partial [Streptococcus pneumoniae]